MMQRCNPVHVTCISRPFIPTMLAGRHASVGVSHVCNSKTHLGMPELAQGIQVHGSLVEVVPRQWREAPPAANKGCVGPR